MNEFEEKLKEIEKKVERLLNQEDKYRWEITKYFDRIHDKLFTLNNIYIAAYLGLIAFKSDVRPRLNYHLARICWLRKRGRLPVLGFK